MKSSNEIVVGELIDKLHAGEKYIGPKIRRILSDRAPRINLSAEAVRGKASLSRREYEVLSFLDQGFSQQDIAMRLSLSIQTIRQHYKSLKRKLAIAGMLDRLD